MTHLTLNLSIGLPIVPITIYLLEEVPQSKMINKIGLNH